MKRMSPWASPAGLVRAFRVVGGPPIFLALTIVLLVLIPLLAKGIRIGEFDVFNGLKTFASLGLVALALSLTMVLGEFDLSVLGSYAFGGLVGVQVGQDHPFLGLAAAIGVGAVTGVIQSEIMTRLRLSSVPVTLGGLLILLGLTYRLSDGKDVPFKDIDFGLSIDTAVFNVISVRALVSLAVCAVVALVLTMTAAGRLVRAVGGDRRGSETNGLPVRKVVVVVFAMSGACSALAGAMAAYALASAQASIGFQPLTFAVTAALIGGVTLAGGRGGVVGITCAAVALSLVQGIFQVIALQVYYSDVIMGALLAVVAAVQAPGLRDKLRARQARRAGPGESVDQPAMEPALR
jgi:ribose transport system permease protein